MRWKIVHKDSSRQKTGVYTDWKEDIAEECHHQCVYCSIHESQWGGIDHFHIDHFRPKSRAEFKCYENDICNLFYACPVCNRFKKDDWPGDPDLNKICYPDPSKTDYNEIFSVDASNFHLTGVYLSSKYIIERLLLNRPQLIFERREFNLMQKAFELYNRINELSESVDDHTLLREVIQSFTNYQNLIIKKSQVRPYKLTEIRKP